MNEFPGAASFLAISNNKKRLAAAFENTLTIYSLNSGLIVEIKKYPLDIQSIHFLPGSTDIALNFGFQVLIRSKTGDKTLRPDGKAYQVVFNQSGTLAAVLQNSGLVEVFNTSTGKLLPIRISHASLVYTAHFINSDSHLLTGSADKTFRMWNLQTGLQVGPILAHEDGVVQIAVSPDEVFAATAGLDGTVRLWKTSAFAPVEENPILFHADRIENVAFASTNRLVSKCVQGKVTVWELSPYLSKPDVQPREDQLESKLKINLAGVSLSAQAEWLNGEANGQLISYRAKGPIETIDLSFDHRFIAVGTSDSTLKPHDVVILDGKGIPTPVTLRHRDGVKKVTFEPKGHRLATSSEDFTCIIWDAATGEQLTEPMTHQNQIHWVSFNASGNWIVTASWDKTAVVWNSHTGEPITPPFRFKNILEYARFNNDDTGLHLANPAYNYTIALPRFVEPPAKLEKLLPDHPSLQQAKKRSFKGR